MQKNVGPNIGMLVVKSIACDFIGYCEVSIIVLLIATFVVVII